MKTRILNWWYWLRSGFLFLPAVMVAGSVVLGLTAGWLDGVFRPDDLAGSLWAQLGGLEGGRTIMQVVAGSMITVAGVVFSITMVVLSLASSQFGPRLMRNFMDDKTNQVVLGVFVATFVYCLLVLATMGKEGASAPVSVVMGLAVTAADLAVLIFFIHHISASVLASNLVAGLGRDFSDAVERLYPEELPEGPEDDYPDPAAFLPEGFDKRAGVVGSHKSGYLQMVAHESLLSLACRENLIIRLLVRPGDFLVLGNPVALVWPPESLDGGKVNRLRSSLYVGDERTQAQDLDHMADLLCETAERALSPGINDPYTAMTCLDWLGAGFAVLAGRRIPPALTRDEEGEPRVVAPAATLPDVAALAFSRLRQAGCGMAEVAEHILITIGRVASHLHREEDRRCLLEQAGLVREEARARLILGWDKERVNRAHQNTLEALERAMFRTGAEPGGEGQL